MSEPHDDRPGDVLQVTPSFAIPRAELATRTSRASGAGGQHVNKTESRVEVTWNVRTSAALSDVRRARLLDRLAGRLSAAGELRVVASDTRSQSQNRALAESRLAEVVRGALAVRKARKATTPSKAAKRARLDAKRRRADTKRRRRPPGDE